MSFPCTGCGLCCKRVGAVVTKAREAGFTSGPFLEVVNFPYQFDTAGKCEMLDDNNQCKVYDSRPDICSIEKTWEIHHKDNISKEDYYQRGINYCNQMIVEAGIDEQFLIN